MFKIFKPSWLVIDYGHERCTFDTYIDFYPHTSLEEICDLYNINSNELRKDSRGDVYYAEEYHNLDGSEPMIVKTEDNLAYGLIRKNIAQTLIIPARKIKHLHEYIIMGNTNNKFGLFDLSIRK